MQASGMPFVIAGAPINGVACNCVTADYSAGIELAINRLIDADRRKIGLVNGDPQTQSSREKYRGMRLALSLSELAFGAHRVLNGDFSSEAGYACTLQMLEQAPEIDAIVFANDEMAIGFIGALQRAGKSVPEDVSVVGFDDIEFANHVTPRLTTIRQPRAEIGEVAAKTLLQLIDGAEIDQADRQLDIELVPRASTSSPLQG